MDVIVGSSSLVACYGDIDLLIGNVHLHAWLEEPADGQSLSATYTLELIDPATGNGSGSVSGEFGPVEAKGTRLTVEPQGTPVGPIEDLFSGSKKATR